jgi:hypothetical protein
MCLVSYTELLNAHIHDPLVSCIESDIGQNSKDLADALNRTHTRDGKNILQVLHVEGMLKKVNTEQIVMTPAPNVRIKLNELNKILDEMEQGESATRKMAEMDKSLGMTGNADVVRKMRGNQLNEQNKARQNRQAALSAPTSNTLNDSDLASNLQQQAQKMITEAKGLLAEADRLQKQASGMIPPPVVTATKPVKAKKKTKASA